jgi:hypothetical protein
VEKPTDGGILLTLKAPEDITSPQALKRIGPNVARVHAGLHVWEVNAALERHGLALANMGAIANQVGDDVDHVVHTGDHILPIWVYFGIGVLEMRWGGWPGFGQCGRHCQPGEGLYQPYG